MADIIAPEGSPLSVAVLGTGDMEASLQLYRDMIGLDVVEWLTVEMNSSFILSTRRFSVLSTKVT